jgi:hypothetical protein
MFTKLLIDIIKKHYDIIIVSIIMGIILSAYFWYPAPRELLATTLGPIATAVGVLLASRIHTKATYPKLSLNWNYYKFKESIRIYAIVKNKEGRSIAKDTKAIIFVKKILNGKEVELESEDLIEHHGYNTLVPKERPIIDGELIPWAVPESPASFQGIHGKVLKHIANIVPGQVNRALLFDVKRCRDHEYDILVFSEYGTEEVKMLRCILRPSHYRFVIKASADNAYPVEGIVELNIPKDEIKFIRPQEQTLKLTRLLQSY